MIRNPSPGSNANRACPPCTSGDVKCCNGPLCKWRMVEVCWFQHRHEEDHPVVEQRQLPSDIATGVTRVVGLCEDILLLMRSTSTDGQRDQSQPGDQRDIHHAADLLGKFWRRRHQRFPSKVAMLSPMRPLEPWTPRVRGRKSRICSHGLTVQCPGSGRQCCGNGKSLMQMLSASRGHAASDASCWEVLMSTRLGSDALSWHTGTKGMRMPWTPKVEGELRVFQELYELDQKPSCERVLRRKTARSKQRSGPSCVNGPLRKEPWLVRPRQPRVALVGARRESGAEHHGHRGWMVPEQGRQCLPSFGCLSADLVVRFSSVLRLRHWRLSARKR